MFQNRLPSFADIGLRTVGKKQHMPGNVPSDALSIHPHRHHRCWHMSRTGHLQTRCLGPCSLQLAGRLERNPCQVQYNAPSSLHHSPASRKPHNCHKRLRKRCMPRYRIHTVAGPCCSPLRKKMMKTAHPPCFIRGADILYRAFYCSIPLLFNLQ